MTKLAALVPAIVFAVGLGARPARCDEPLASPVRVALPADVTPDHYDIEFRPDAERLSFRGAETIALTVHHATRVIKMNAADLVMDTVALSGQGAAPRVQLDPGTQTVRFTFAQTLQPGRHRLRIAWHGRISVQASGLFALDYQANGRRRRALYTQFENADARRFAPSFDEPGRKASFTLAAIVPAGEMAVSNMPVASIQPAAAGLKRVRFAETPKMSSYLLFFALGDFERVSRRVGRVDVGVVVKRGDRAAATYALDAAAQILPWYEAWFAKRFPLPKLDLIAGPGSSQFFGAMENWGAIFAFERDLLIDPRMATEADRHNVYLVVAHEMAHQWFGDLVTMGWWDDLWLNEGFASWMETKVADHFHPEWQAWSQALEATQRAMQLDAADGSHPVITPIADVQQASDAFDAITYDKGAAVVRMLEHYVGEDVWLGAVRRYVARHAYGSAVSDDLWREVDAQSPRKITDIAHDFTLQAGVPMIRVESWPATYTLSQARFGLDSADLQPRSWRVPVTRQDDRGGNGVVSADQPWTSHAPFRGEILNPDARGYYRSLYDTAALSRVLARYPALSPRDQLGLIGDVEAGAYAGFSPMSAWMSVLEAIPPGADPVVWQAAAGRIAELDRRYDARPTRSRFRAWGLARLRPLSERLGWDSRPGEPPNTAAERTAVLTALARLGERTVLAEARRRFDALGSPESTKDLPRPLGRRSAEDPAARALVLAIVAQAADPAVWERLHDMARRARTELERRGYYELLGHAGDGTLAARALDLALLGEPASTTAPSIIGAVAIDHPDLALAYVVAHWASVRALLEPDSAAGFAPRLAAGSAEPGAAAALEAFAAKQIAPNDRRPVRAALARIRDNARIRATRLPEVDRWLADRALATSDLPDRQAALDSVRHLTLTRLGVDEDTKASR